MEILDIDDSGQFVGMGKFKGTTLEFIASLSVISLPAAAWLFLLTPTGPLLASVTGGIGRNHRDMPLNYICFVSLMPEGLAYLSLSDWT
jgi:hypothetical protein